MTETAQIIHLEAQVGDRTSQVRVGEGVAAELGARVAALAPSRPVFVVIDDGAPADKVEAALGHPALQSAIRYTVPGGEPCKTWASLQAVLEAALSAGCGRQSVVVGIGGGATCDLSGLVAHLLGRGAPLVLVPTTLLSQVDASVGGKCAINAVAGRNLVGAFHPATDVLIDPEWLPSLSAGEQRSGLAELLKTALIRDAALFSAVVTAGGVVGAKEIARSVELKAQIVKIDPFEKNERRLLNLGHTLAHGLESASNYSIRHGEAVAMGIGAASRLSVARGLLPAEKLIEISAGFTAAHLPFEAPPSLLEKAEQYIAADKKNSGAQIGVVLLEDIGRACVQELSLMEAQRALIQHGGKL